MRHIIIDERISEKCERSLMKMGFNPIKLPRDPSLGDAVCSHPDTVVFYNSKEMITTADYCDVAPYLFSDIREYAPDIKIHFTSDVRSSVYPQDCIMNALVIGDKLFCKTDSVSEAILDLAKRNNYKIINVNQGYPACSTLVFGNTAITADRGMAKTLSDEDIDVLLIQEGHIALPPHKYGFIGGSAGVYDNKVLFFGDLLLHPDGEAILNKINGAGYEAVCLSDEPLADFGGFILL